MRSEQERDYSHGGHLYEAKKLTEASFPIKAPAEVIPTAEMCASQQDYGASEMKQQGELTGD